MSPSGQRYEKIQVSDDTDMRTADSGRVSLGEEEQDGLLDSHGRGPRYSRFFKLSTTSPLTTVCLSISNVVTLVIVYLLLLSRGSPDSLDSQCPTPTTVVYPPRPAWFPPEIPVTKVLHGDKLYSQAPSPESIEAWNQLLPKGRGWVRVNNESALPDLPGLNHSLPEHRAFPTIFHQLHCLYSTKDSYYELLNVTYGHGEKKRELGPGDPGWDSEHLNHCWDYLRQTIMCNADVTLEWKKYDEKVGTGWGYQHQCKDWDAIIAWAEDHRTSNSWGILRGGGERIPLE